MKKPNITGGTWIYKEEKKIIDSDINADSLPGGCMICEVDYIGTDEEEEEANAKAISAVPEMIDALIKARQCYQGVGDFESCGEMMSQIIPEIDKALQKAGVEV